MLNKSKYLFLMLLPYVGPASGKEKIKQKKPNFIFIYSDDLRQDALGSYGNGVIKTPALDRLASQGMRFTNANVVFSLSSPSRAALLTGRYGSVNGVLELESDLNPDEKTVAQYLRNGGYLTGMSGKWHIGRKPADAGFDFSVWFEGNGTYYGRTIHDEGKTVTPEMHCDQYCANRSVDFLNEAARSGKPFFLFHNTQLPHMNGKLIWDARRETKGKYKTSDLPVAKSRFDNLADKPKYLKTIRNRTQAKEYGYPDSVAIQNHTLDYYSVITEMDEYLDQLFKTIDELGLRENTYIFFMSDNGWMLGEHGFTSKVLPYRPSTSVPLFVLGPNLKPAVNNKLVLNIDMAPTILGLAGIKISDDIQGKSIVPFLNDKQISWRNAFVYEGLGSYGGAKPNLTVISKDFRLIVTYEDEKLNKIHYRELYDQEMDTDEMKNLIQEPKYKKDIERLQKEIETHKKNILKNNSKYGRI
jgi:arylsulfatase A-like enzyme